MHVTKYVPDDLDRRIIAEQRVTRVATPGQLQQNALIGGRI